MDEKGKRWGNLEQVLQRLHADRGERSVRNVNASWVVAKLSAHNERIAGGIIHSGHAGTRWTGGARRRDDRAH
jgi:hypothetical protein